MNGTKPGWKTSEFYLTLLTNLISVIGVLKGIIPGNWAAVTLTVVNGIYTIFRSLVKSNAPDATTPTTPAS